MTDDRAKRMRQRAAVYPWLRRDYFKTSVSWLVSLAFHGILALLLLFSVILTAAAARAPGPGARGNCSPPWSGTGN